MKRVARHAGWLTVLAGAVALFDWRYAAGFIPFDSDNCLYYIPMWSLWQERPWPLWDPYLFCGMPLLGNLQFAMFYPPCWVFRWVEVLRAYGPFVFSHYLLAGWGAYALGCVLGLRRAAAALGALTFACGSYMQGRIINPTLFLSTVWMPLLLACAVWTVRRGTWRAAGVLALAGAALCHAGSPHNIFYGAVAVALAAVWHLVLPYSRCAVVSRARAAALLVVAGVLVAAMFAPAWWHALGLLPRTVRAGATFADVTADPLLPGEAARLWLGGLGTPEYGDKTSFGGAVVLALSLSFGAAALRQRGRGVGRWLCGPGGLGVALCALGVAAALGARGGLYHLIYAVPGFRFLIGPSRGLVLFNLGWSVIAGALLDQWLRARRPAGGWLVALAAGAVLLAAGVWMTGGQAATVLRMVLLLPRHAPAEAVPWFLGGAGLMVAAVILRVASDRHVPVGAAVAVVLLVHVTSLLHFRERVFWRWGRYGQYAQTLSAEPLRQLLSGETGPGRVLGWQPERVVPMDFHDTRGPAHLLPKLPDLLRLPEVQGYDAMMSQDFVRLMTLLAGRHPADDPFRTAHVGDPASVFTDLTGARHIVGRPYEQAVRLPDQGLRRLDLALSAPLVAVSMVTAGSDPRQPDGARAGEIVVRGRDGSETVLPVRYGIETAHPLAAEGYPYANHRAPEPARRWTAFEPRAGREIRVQTSYARLALPQPVEAVSLECRDAPGSGGWTPIRVMVETLPLPAEEGRFRLERRWVVTRSPAGGASMWEEARSGDEWPSAPDSRQETFALYRNGRALPLAYVVRATTEAGTLDEAAAAIRALGSEGLRHVAVVEPGATPTEMHATAPDAIASSGTVARLHRLSPNAAMLTVQTEAPSLLVFVESWDPGWRAWLNGREVPIVRVNGIFQGILLPEPGRHVAVFRYRPRSLAPTLAAAVAGLAGAGSLALAGGRTRRRKS
jgi:hypothetical protein